jgi:hypothetical protein
MPWAPVVAAAVGGVASAAASSAFSKKSSGGRYDQQAGALSQAQADIAKSQHSFWTKTYATDEKALVAETARIGTPADQEREARIASDYVHRDFGLARRGAEDSLKSYGIDPSSPRYQGLNRESRIAEAGSSAAAANAGRLNARNYGLTARMSTTGMGRNLPANAMTGLGQAAGQSALLGQSMYNRGQTAAGNAALAVAPIAQAVGEWAGPKIAGVFSGTGSGEILGAVVAL